MFIKFKKRWKIYLVLLLFLFSFFYSFIYPAIIGFYYEISGTLNYEKETSIILNNSENLTITLESPEIYRLKSFKMSGDVNGSALVYLKAENNLYLVFNETNSEFNNSCIESCDIDEFNQTSFVLIVEVNGSLKISMMSYVVENLSWIEEDKKIDENIKKNAEENGSVELILILKEPNKFSIKTTNKKEDIEEKKKNIDIAQESVEQSLNESGIEVKYKYETINAIVVSVKKDAIDELEKDKDIETIIEPREFVFFLSESVPLINATNVHGIQIDGINITGSGEVACVIDSGIDYNHSALGGGWGNKVIGGYDFYNNDSDPYDDYGHGTAVSGVIISDGNIRGVAPDSKVVALKACGTSSCNESAILASIDWCINNSAVYNISVMSISLGSATLYSDYCDSYFPLYSNIVNLSNSLNISVVAATGNAYNTSGIASPACINNVIAVGSVDDGSQETTADVVSYFSNRNNITDVLAPGSLINTTYLNNGFISGFGTSLATPHVSGMILLINQYNKLLGNEKLKPIVIDMLLKKTGKRVYDSSTGIYFPRIDVLEAINKIPYMNQSENSIMISGKAKIIFNQNVDLSFVPIAFDIEHNFLSLDSINYSQYNVSANITLYNLSYLYEPVVLKDGIVCVAPLCNITDYNGNLTFSVSGFTNYTSATNSELIIFDENDVEGGYLNRTRYENITFFANYSNRTSKAPISNASCNISFSDENASMTYDPMIELFKYQKMFFVAGLYNYSINCSTSGFENLEANDTITVLPLSGCNFPPPDKDWFIYENESVLCENENILMQNQSIVMSGNGTIILNNSNLTFNHSSLLYFNISDNATFEMGYSNIRSTGPGVNFRCWNNSFIEIYDSNVSIGSGSINTYGSCNSVVNDSFISSTNQIAYYENSTSEILNSVINVTILFSDQSYNVIDDSYLSIARLDINSTTKISNSTITVLRSGTSPTISAPIINFTSPQSSIINSIELRPGNLTIDGYINMPNNLTLSLIGNRFIKRFYPVYTNYVNESPTVNRTVNVTNNGILLWQGNTDSYGIAYPELNFTNETMNNVYNITANPTQNISLLTDTPIIFLIAIPNITIVSPENNSLDLDGNITFIYQVNDSDSTISNCSLYLNESLNQTNTTISEGINQSFSLENVSDGTYEWHISCYDDSGNLGISEKQNFNVDTTPPAINLIAPASNITITTSNVTFYYNVTDDMTSIANCSLVLNGITNETKTTIIEAVTQNFTKSLPNGNYNWRIECYDENGWIGSSAIRNFAIQSPYCGDSSCNNGETCGSCSIDCGVCPRSGGGYGGGGGIIAFPPAQEEEENGSIVESAVAQSSEEVEETIKSQKEEKIPETEKPIKLEEESVWNAVANKVIWRSAEAIKNGFNRINGFIEEGGKGRSLVILSPLFLLLLIYLFYYPFLPMTKRTYADDEMIGRLIAEKRIKHYRRLYVLPDVFNKYKYVKIDGKDIKNLRVVNPTKKDEENAKKLYQEFKIDIELLFLIVIAKSRSLFAKILTMKEIPEELKNKWSRINFENPFDDEERDKKAL